jgi:hypothetical protein
MIVGHPIEIGLMILSTVILPPLGFIGMQEPHVILANEMMIINYWIVEKNEGNWDQGIMYVNGSWINYPVFWTLSCIHYVKNMLDC